MKNYLLKCLKIACFIYIYRNQDILPGAWGYAGGKGNGQRFGWIVCLEAKELENLL